MGALDQPEAKNEFEVFKDSPIKKADLIVVL